MDYSHNQISLKSFRRRVCIDWLKLILRFQNQIHFYDIQKIFTDVGWEKPHVEAVEEKSGRVANTFILTIHDRLANDYQALRQVLENIGSAYPMSDEPTIHGIEIACDFYRKGLGSNHLPALKADLLALTYRLQTSLYVKGGKNHRQYDPAIKGNRYLDSEGVRITPEQNFRINPEGSGLSWHVYFKWFDKFNKIKNTFMTLEPDKWRARVEVTILGEELSSFGLVKLADLNGYRFETLASLS